MKRTVTALAVLTVGFAASGLIMHALARRRKGEQREALQTWESEGGAVPVTANRTAAQVLPHAEHSGAADAAHG